MILVKHPNPKLLQECDAVTDFGDNLHSLVYQMKAFMKTLWGRPQGLAAPQVGYFVKVFITQSGVYVNAEIIKKSQETYTAKEGCYSEEPNRFDYPAQRHVWVILKYQRLNGCLAKKRFSGKAAQVIQHEVDHIYGKLCCGGSKCQTTHA